MRAVPRKDSVAEIRLRRRLWSEGLRYRKHLYVAATHPDICLTRLNLAIFVDGCFWHGCPKHYRTPTANAAVWKLKIEKNKERDRKNTMNLELAGWRVLRFWECEVLGDLDQVYKSVRQAIRSGDAR